MGNRNAVFQVLFQNGEEQKDGADCVLDLGSANDTIQEAKQAMEGSEDAIGIIRTDTFTYEGVDYQIPRIVNRNVPEYVLKAWKEEQDKPKPVTRKLRKSHIGFNYHRWNDPETVKRYAGISRLLMEAYSLPDASWAPNEAAYRHQEISTMIAAGKGYVCLNCKPRALEWSGDEDCGWWNKGTDGTKLEHYSDMMEVNAAFVYEHAGVIVYYEGENERRRWWQGEKLDNQYNAVQEAVSQKAIYLTVKAIDPSIKVVFAGMSYLDDDRLFECKQIWDEMWPGEPYPFDIMSAHHYCSAGNEAKKVNVTTPISPKADKAGARFKRFTKSCHKMFGEDLIIWLGEGGNSVNESTNVVHEHNLEVSALEAANWTMELAELAIANGFDAVQIFLLQDLGDYDLYGRCGHYFSSEEPGKPRAIKVLGKAFLSLYNKLPD